jgi:hypothetical protein
MGTWGGGGIQIAWPLPDSNATTVATQIEYLKVPLQAANTSPFTGQQEIQTWGASYSTASVSLPTMNASDGNNWLYFFDLLDGILNVFQFPTSFCSDSRFTYWVTSDGTHSKYFRLKSPTSYHSVQGEGATFNISFEIREAI